MPLSFDMPLEKLPTYQGRTPCPADMDAFWDRALAEMRAVDPKVELVRSSFQAPGAECFDLYFTGVKGARIHAKYARPAVRNGRLPAVVQFHGYSGNCGDWIGKLAWVGAGFCIAALDCRGQGGMSQDLGGVTGNTLRGHIIRGLQDGPEQLLFRSVYLDTAQLAGLVMGLPEVAPGRVGALGGSQGGGLTLACAALACGRWSRPRTPTRSSRPSSASSTRSTSASARSLPRLAILTVSILPSGSRPRC